MARYVCKCGGNNPYCTTCWGERYYTPRGAAKNEKENEKSIPLQRIESPTEFDTQDASTQPDQFLDEVEPTDASSAQE